MDQITHEKIVDFAYCGICKNQELTEMDEPCSTCIANPVNFESKKPIKYEEDPIKVKRNSQLIKEKHLHVKGD